MILVIGYGNTLCGDDGLGPYAVEQLQDAESLPGAEYLTQHQLLPELAEDISRADTVLFVDAAADDKAAPGAISCYEITLPDQPSPAAPGAFTHHVNATILLENARLLYGAHPTAWLYTVAGENFGLGEPFSPAVEAAIPLLVAQIKQMISQNSQKTFTTEITESAEFKKV